MKPVRLQKYMADCGVASRRKSEEMIQRGWVQVNDVVVTQMGVTIDPAQDEVKVQGKTIALEKKKTIMLNKPKGYVCTFRKFPGEKSIALLVPEDTQWHSVGRLDKNTTGLLLLTNDGQLTQKITHPAKEIKKVYHVLVHGQPDKEQLETLKKGVTITNEEGTYVTAPAQARILGTKGQQTRLKIVITEGKKRQVRHMCEAIDCRVLALKRVAIGNLHLGNLPEGQWRALTERDFKEIFSE